MEMFYLIKPIIALSMKPRISQDDACLVLTEAISGSPKEEIYQERGFECPSNFLLVQKTLSFL